MNLTSITLDYKRVTIIAILIVAIIGIINYFDLERDSMPPYTIRIASVVTSFPGADPNKVEMLVTEPLEETIREISQVKTITSESRPGLSVITVELLTDVNSKELQSVWTNLRNKIEALKPSLPQGIYGPLVKDEDIGKVFGIIIGVTGDGVPYHKLEDYAKAVREKLLLLRDVEKIKYGGVQNEQIFIEFDNKQLSRYGLDVIKLKGLISSTNILNPGGEINIGRKRIVLEPSGGFETIEDIKKILVPLSSGSTVYLEDITTRIYRDYVTPSQKKVFVNGKEAIALFISLKDGANIVRLGNDVDKALVEINNNLPLGVEVVRSASQDKVVNKQVNDFLINLVQSIVIVLSVMLIFLGLRTGSLVASLIPMVILTSFFFLGFLNLGFNKVSLAALIISLGLLVDNGIVVSESIMVNMNRGMSAIEASIYSGKVLIVPLLISSLTTAAAFLPFALAKTPMGEISSQLFWVVSSTLISSWFLAFTFIPLVAVIILKTKPYGKVKRESTLDKGLDRFNMWYNKMLYRTLKRPKGFLIAIVSIFLIAVFMIRYLPFKLVPDSDRNLVTLDIKFPTGTQIEYTQQAVKKIENYILNNLMRDSSNKSGGAAVLDFSTFIGEGPEPYDLGYFKNESNSSYAHMLVNTTGDKDNDYIISKLDSFCFKSIPDAEIRVNRLTGAGASGTPVEIRISGDNPEKLALISQEVKSKLIELKLTKNINDDWGPKIQKLIIDIHPDKVMRSGLTNMDIAIALNAGLSGVRIGDFYDSDKKIPIFFKNEANPENYIETLQAFTIYSPSKSLNVPLLQVADIKVDWQFGKVIRKDLRRTMTVGAYLDTDYTASDVFKKIGPWLETKKGSWGSGYTYELGGEDEDKSENLGAIFENLPLAFFLIALLLVLQFNSFRKTTIIILSIPLGIIGVTVGWFIGGSFISFFGILGVIALAGIVVNNSIILIDRIEIEMLEDVGIDKRDAILKAVKSRFRPVILTTLTTSLGMLPLWFSGDLLWVPLALAIIFGLLFATFITIIFVPVLYSIFYKVSFLDHNYKY